ncbi:beta-lactamase/transpeptidase-like protein [Mycena amicta]|nr:beta-lactamase/transpeptidase-like protein [Mycena amicta]
MFRSLPLLLLAFQTISKVAASADTQQPLHVDKRILLSPDVDEAIETILKDFRTPGGVGVAVVHKDAAGEWNVETKGYGFARLDKTKATSDTLWGIGSNSKLFDILATGLVISNASVSPRISWNSKMADIFQDWGLMDPVAERESTIVDIMSHRTGLPRHDLILTPENATETMKRLRYLRPSAGFREQYQYNNHFYTVLSQIPPQLTGIPFAIYVDRYIFQPLGMKATTYFSTVAEESGNLADGIARDAANQTEDVFDLGIPRTLPFWLPNGMTDHVISGPGGVISSANDMAIWLQTLIGEGQHPSTKETIIPAEVVRRVASGVTVATPVAPFPELSPSVYGGGQHRGTYRGFEIIEHGGSVEGFKSQVTRFPSQNFGVAVMSNDEPFGFYIVEAIKSRIIDEFFKLEPIDWTARFRELATGAYKGIPTATPRPTNATPPLLPFEKLAGTYQNLGYGTIELCFFTPEPSSAGCQELVKEIPTTLPGVIDPKIPTLLSHWKIFGLSHVSLTHFDGNVFNITGLNSKPTGNSSQPFWVAEQAAPGMLQAEWAYDGGALGVAMRGVWGAGEGVKSPVGESVKDRAEIWFEKLN